MLEKDFTVKNAQGQEVLLTFVNPQADEIEDSKKRYARAVARIVKNTPPEELLTRDQLEEVLERTGTWTQEDKNKIAGLQNKIAALYKKLKAGGEKLSEGRAIAVQMNDLRREIIKVNQKRQSFDDATVESMAEEEQKDYLVWCCTRNQDGSHYWEAYEDMKEDKLSRAYSEANQRVLSFLYDIDPNFEKNLPENKWLRKYNFIDDELNFVDRKTKVPVDRNGNPIQMANNQLMDAVQAIVSDMEEDSPYLDDDTGEPVGATLDQTEKTTPSSDVVSDTVLDGVEKKPTTKAAKSRKKKEPQEAA